MEAASFALGFRFYYWPYYQFKESLPLEEQTIFGESGRRHKRSGHQNLEWDNKIDHSGFRPCDLYVTAKYGSFKEEMSNYEHFDKKQMEAAGTKAAKYLKTDTIKRFKAYYWKGNKREKKVGTQYCHYDIDMLAVVAYHHLLSLILYTDFTKVCTNFSASFRRIRPFESLSSIKKRNSAFFWMSKHLRELVEIFGDCAYGDAWPKESLTWGDDNYEEYINYAKPYHSITGPFYCGMSVKLNITSFSMRLCSPTSTSKQIAVAAKFSGSKGMVITFDNPREEVQYRHLRGWDCSWISRFKEEDERLFFGGFYRMQLENVRLVATQQNFTEYIQSIWYLDAMITGASLGGIAVSKRQVALLRHLVKYAVKGAPSKVKVDQYIYDTFTTFTKSKRELIFDLPAVEKGANEKIRNLFFIRWNGKSITMRFNELMMILPIYFVLICLLFSQM